MIREAHLIGAELAALLVRQAGAGHTGGGVGVNVEVEDGGGGGGHDLLDLTGGRAPGPSPIPPWLRRALGGHTSRCPGNAP